MHLTVSFLCVCQFKGGIPLQQAPAPGWWFRDPGSLHLVTMPFSEGLFSSGFGL